MAITFGSKPAPAPAPKQTPTWDLVPPNGVFSTDFGTIYVKSANGQFAIKLGNKDKSSRNEVVVKQASYFLATPTRDLHVYPNARVDLGV